MGENSKIEWTDATWPCVQGCDPVSQGCVGCYAVPLLWRMAHTPNPKVSGPLQGVTEKHVNAAGETVLRFTGKIALREDRLDWPLKWRQPRMIFVPSHGDIFHKDVPDSFLDKIFAVMALCPQHTFQVLTKRAERMRHYCSYLCNRDDLIADAALSLSGWPKRAHPDRTKERRMEIMRAIRNFLPNVWLGISAEDQPNADERIPLLLQTPAAVRFVSLEPLLGPIDLTNLCNGHWFCDALTGARWHDDPDGGGAHDTIGKLSWIIAGGESGPKARPMHPDWARSLRDQCAAAGVAFFFKQWGAWRPHKVVAGGDLGGDMRADRVRLVHREEHSDAELCKRSAFPGDRFMTRVGKKASGRLLGGVEHNGFPNENTPTP